MGKTSTNFNYLRDLRHIIYSKYVNKRLGKVMKIYFQNDLDSHDMDNIIISFKPVYF